MPKRDVIVIGGSAGCISTLITLVHALPANFDAQVFITVHLRSQTTSALPQILRRAGKLDAAFPYDGQQIEPGMLCIAPSDKHLMFEDGVVRLSTGPHENGFRPAIDPMFRSAAQTYGRRVIAVVLSGVLDDGTFGLNIVKKHGGVSVVQDPDDVEFPEMPLNALQSVAVDHVCSRAGLAELLITLSKETVELPSGREGGLAIKIDEPVLINEDVQRLTPFFYSCPECGGVLVPHWDGDLVHYVCQVQHTYSPQALFNEQTQELERALWAGLRGLEEKARLAEQIATKAQEQGNSETAERFSVKARQVTDQANLLRELLRSFPG